MYEVLRECKDYGLRDQMQRAAVSIASNIAEGSERSRKEFARFLGMACGSAAELRTQVYIVAKIGVINTDARQEIVNELKELSKMLYGLAKALKTEHIDIGQRCMDYLLG